MKNRYEPRTRAGILGAWTRWLRRRIRPETEENEARYSQAELPWNIPDTGNPRSLTLAGLGHSAELPAHSRRAAVSGARFPERTADDRTPHAGLEQELQRENHAFHGILLRDALKLKSAEYWLRLGEADQALQELEGLPEGARSHPSAIKTRLVAIRSLGHAPENH